MKPPTLDDLRRYAIARSLFKPTTLPKAIDRLGFVQADPIRAPARAQDLTLRHRVVGLPRGRPRAPLSALGLEEDFFVNYGFLPRDVHALMHPRTARAGMDEGALEEGAGGAGLRAAEGRRRTRARSMRTSRTAR